jgi:hypothetical protein
LNICASASFPHSGPGDIVSIDNLPAHKCQEVREQIETAGVAVAIKGRLALAGVGFDPR